MITAPLASESVEVSVGTPATSFNKTLVPGHLYMITANTALWYAQGANPTAAVGSGAQYLPANTFLFVLGDAGAKVSVIQDATSGRACITRVFTF